MGYTYKATELIIYVIFQLGPVLQTVGHTVGHTVGLPIFSVFVHVRLFQNFRNQNLAIGCLGKKTTGT